MLEDFYKKIAFSAGWLEKPRIDVLGFALHQIEHRLDHPLWGEDLPVVSDVSFGFY